MHPRQKPSAKIENGPDRSVYKVVPSRYLLSSKAGGALVPAAAEVTAGGAAACAAAAAAASRAGNSRTV